MTRFNIPFVARGLTTYAIERQHSYERHQPDGSPPWTEQRRLWTDAILQGMARLEGEQPDPKLMERFDLELEQARGCYFIVPATQQTQKDVILELRAIPLHMDKKDSMPESEPDGCITKIYEKYVPAQTRGYIECISAPARWSPRFCRSGARTEEANCEQ